VTQRPSVALVIKSATALSKSTSKVASLAWTKWASEVSRGSSFCATSRAHPGLGSLVLASELAGGVKTSGTTNILSGCSRRISSTADWTVAAGVVAINRASSLNRNFEYRPAEEVSPGAPETTARTPNFASLRRARPAAASATGKNARIRRELGPERLERERLGSPITPRPGWL